jgi:DNA-binding XRE family transcriptional regulator
LSNRTKPSRRTVQRRKRIVTYVTVEREILSAGPEYVAFAEVLRSLRGQARMTQEDFAKAANYKRPSIANIEAGRQTVSLAQLFAFARILNVKPEKIVAMVAAEMNN